MRIASPFQRKPKTAEELRVLSRNVLALRLKKGWTQAELAHRAGINPGTIGRYNTVRSAPSKPAASKIANCLGVSLDDLWSGDYFSEDHVGETQDEFMVRMRADWARVAKACERAPIVSLRPLLTSEDVRAILLYPSLRTLDRMREAGDIGWTRVGDHLVRFTREQVEDYLCCARARPANPELLQEFGISTERISAHEEQRRIDAAGRRARERIFFARSRDEARARAKAGGATARIKKAKKNR